MIQRLRGRRCHQLGSNRSVQAKVSFEVKVQRGKRISSLVRLILKVESSALADVELIHHYLHDYGLMMNGSKGFRFLCQIVNLIMVEKVIGMVAVEVMMLW